MYNPYGFNSFQGSSLLKFIKDIKWDSILNTTQKTINVINQTIPIINQTKPVINNIKTFFKIFSYVKEDDKVTNTDQNNKNINNKIVSQTKENNNKSNFSGPTFFQ